MFQPKELDNSGGLGSALSETLLVNTGNCGYINLSEKDDISIGSNADSFTGLPSSKSMKLSLYIQKDDLLSYVADELRTAISRNYSTWKK